MTTGVVGRLSQVAEGLARERGFKVYVHPVIPVLKETRGVVKMYNRWVLVRCDGPAPIYMTAEPGWRKGAVVVEQATFFSARAPSFSVAYFVAATGEHAH